MGNKNYTNEHPKYKNKISKFIKKKLHKYTREGIDEAQEKWWKEKDLDLTIDEWQSKSLKEKLSVAGKLNLKIFGKELKKGTDY